MAAIASACAAACMTGTAPASAQSITCDPQKAASNYPAYANRVVKIGANPTYPPFTYNDPSDMTRMNGVDVEIVEEALKCAGLKYEFMRGQTTGLYPALFAGTLDLMLGNIFIRPDRVDKAGFVLYMTNGQSLIVKRGNPKKVVSADTMCGRTATGLYVGTSAMVVQDIGKKCVEKGLPPIDYVAASDQEQAYRSLANDRTDMVMDGSASAALRVASADGQHLELAFTLDTGIKSGIIAPKGNAEMLKAVGDGLRYLRQSGRLAAIMTKYGLQPAWLIEIEVHP
ncbi:MAG: transporter substrate-binding domain-containing protein [Alphaproteobacteria bacterium]|nr:transporter substrate-binding domain-containing protein [Alphaproteobacteria bacterium]